MKPGWVAGSVRARAMAQRRLGAEAVRRLAPSADFPTVVGILADSPYARFLPPQPTVAEAQRAVLDTLLWNLRVLVGWLPVHGVRALRVLAAWFEIANIDEHLAQLAGDPVEPPFRLGALASAWPRLAGTATVADLRTGLATSVWGDPETDDPADITLCLRTVWCRRVVAEVPPAQPWALGAAALLAAHQVAVRGRPAPARAARELDRLLTPGWSRLTGVEELRNALPAAAAWALSDVERPQDLWRAEVAWWARVRADARKLLGSAAGAEPALGAAALLAVDAWQVRAAIGAAARPGQGAGDVLA